MQSKSGPYCQTFWYGQTLRLSTCLWPQRGPPLKYLRRCKYHPQAYESLIIRLQQRYNSTPTWRTLVSVVNVRTQDLNSPDTAQIPNMCSSSMQPQPQPQAQLVWPSNVQCNMHHTLITSSADCLIHAVVRSTNQKNIERRACEVGDKGGAEL